MGSALACSLLVLQAAVMRLSGDDLPVRIVLPLTIALAPVALWPLRRFAGVWVMFVGLAANLAVILANGGLMPIERTTVAEAVGEERASRYEVGAWVEGSKDVLVAPGGGRATALGDRIIVRIGGGGFAASPGDLVIWAGVMILAGEAAVLWESQRRKPSGEVVRQAHEGAGDGAATPQ
jgi:hypothetical protein